MNDFLDFTDFYENHFLVQDVETAQPRLPLVTDNQRIVLDSFFPNGEPAARNLLLGWTKKSGKSTVLAGVMLWTALKYPDSSVTLNSNSLEQSRSRVYAALKFCLKHSKSLDKISTVTRNEVTLSNGSIIRMMSSDSGSAAGSNDRCIVMDELSFFISENDRLRYSELFPPPVVTVFESWLVMQGLPGQSDILYDLWTKAKNSDRVGHDLPIFHNREASLMAAIDEKPFYFRLPWVDEKYLAETKAAESEGSFRRQWLNEWTSQNKEPICTEDEWRALQNSKLPMLSKDSGERLYFGLDLSTTRASSALVGVDVREEKVRVRYLKLWTPVKDDYRDGKPTIDIDRIEAEILTRLHRNNNIAKLSVDTYQAHQMLMNLRKAGVSRIVEIAQQATRYLTDSNLLDLIQQGRLEHNGDSRLAAHIGSVELLETTRGVRFAKQRHGGYIDLAVSLAMAAYQANQSKAGRVKITHYQHNPFYNSGAKIYESPYGGYREDAESNRVLVNGKWLSRTAVIFKHDDPSVTWRNCPNRTRGCVDCQNELRAEGFYSAPDKELWLSENFRMEVSDGKTN